MSIICQICLKEFKTVQGLSAHIKTLHIKTERRFETMENYFDKYYPDARSTCIICGKKSRYISPVKGYHQYCSDACSRMNMGRTKSHKCAICNEAFSKLGSYEKHIINFHKLNLKDYYDTYILINQDTCRECGKLLDTFNNIVGGYYERCHEHLYHCKICGKSFYELCKLQLHITNYHKNVSKIEYYKDYMSDGKYPKCLTCNNEHKKLISFEIGWQKYCKPSCAIKGDVCQEKLVAAYQKKYGKQYTNPSQVPEVRMKISQSLKNRNNGCDNLQKIPEVVAKRKATCKKRYNGYEYPIAAPEVRAKSLQTLKDNYHVDNPMKSKEIQERAKKTCVDRWGVDSPMKVDKIKKAVMKTIIDNHGGMGNASPAIFAKVKKTWHDKWGVDNPNQVQFIKKKTSITLRKQNYQTLLDECSIDGYIPLFTYEDYISGMEELKFNCLTCKKEFIHISKYSSCKPNCPTCLEFRKSKIERRLGVFIREIADEEILYNKRSVLQGKEIDILLPESRLGIEANGEYWHSDAIGVSKYYHILKTKLGLKNDINILHFFESEINEHFDVVKGIILKALGKYKNTIYANDLTIKNIYGQEVETFLSKNTLSTYTNGCDEVLSLSQGDDVSAVLLINYGEDIQVEYIENVDVKVVGGLDALLEAIKLKDVPIIIHSDVRFNPDPSAFDENFTYVGITEPNLWYTHYQTGGLRRYITPEEEDAFNPIKLYDCGHHKFTLTL